MLVDHTAPVTSASLAPGSPSNAPVTVSFTAGDGSGSGVSTTSYRVDGGTVLQGSSVIVSAPGDHSNDGNHVVQFFSTDDVGNVETPKTVNVLIDTTAPSGTPGDPGNYLRGIANLTYSTAAADVSSVQFQFSPASAGAWSNIGSADVAPPYAAVLDDDARRRRPVRPARRRHRRDRQRRQRAPPRPAQDGRQHGSVGLRHVARRRAVRLRQRHRDCDRDRRRRAARLGRLGRALRGQAVRRRLVHRLRHADRAGLRLDVPAGAGTGSFADGPADLQVVVTDVAGNETTSATRTINIDNAAPTVTLDDPGAAVGASVNLSATSSADTTDVTFRYRPVGSGAAGTLIGSDATAPFTATWTTSPAAEQQWELIAVATDGGGNVSTSAPRVVLVDRTLPTGSVTAPRGGATVGGSGGRAHRNRRRRRRLRRRAGRVAGQALRRRHLQRPSRPTRARRTTARGTRRARRTARPRSAR